MARQAGTDSMPAARPGGLVGMHVSCTLGKVATSFIADSLLCLHDHAGVTTRRQQEEEAAAAARARLGLSPTPPPAGKAAAGKPGKAGAGQEKQELQANGEAGGKQRIVVTLTIKEDTSFKVGRQDACRCWHVEVELGADKRAPDHPSPGVFYTTSWRLLSVQGSNE
jgi:hypothetical protein